MYHTSALWWLPWNTAGEPLLMNLTAQVITDAAVITAQVTAQIPLVASPDKNRT